MKETMNVNGFDFSAMTDFSNLEKQLEGGGNKFVDKTIWAPDKKSPQTYTFKFIPFVHNGNLNSFVTIDSHRITHFPDGKPSTFYGICARTKDQLGIEKHKCKLCERGWGMYNTKEESNMKASEGWRPKQIWMSNILMISDPVNPDNNGKVFKYEFGISIFRMIQERWKPVGAALSDEDFVQYNPFDWRKSGNFKLVVNVTETFDARTKKKITMPDYKQSQFTNKIVPISTDKNKVNEIMNKSYDLLKYIDEMNVITDERINTELGYILKISDFAVERDEIEEVDEEVVETKKAKTTTQKAKKAKIEVEEDSEVSGEVTPEMEDFFNELS